MRPHRFLPLIALLLPLHAIAADVPAVSTAKFLDSIGIVTAYPDRGQPVERTIEMVKYCGFRWVRGGIEGVTDDGPTTTQTYLQLHEATGVKFSWGLASGGTDVTKLLRTARVLARADALLAFEGNNEPNNWGVAYQGEQGGGEAPSWLAVAKLQRDMYQAVKSDPLLAKYPVWSISESGAERDNVGLQFLTIPAGAETLMPAGTTFADYANCHNYIYHPASSTPADNKCWNAASPGSDCRVDGLYGNFGRTWAMKFPGYSDAELERLPRVTTETGTTIGGAITEERHALDLTNSYLAQFKRGWSCTSPYLLRDREDEGGNQAFGFFDREYQPRLAAKYLHNLTTILADDATAEADAAATALDYEIEAQPETMHDLLLMHSDGTLRLVLWGERLTGEDRVTVRFGSKQATIAIYDPTKGVEPVAHADDAESIEVVISDHPLVIALPKR